MINSNSPDSKEQISSEEENVFYCARCLSLAVKTFRDQDFCINCGSTDIRETDFNEWEVMYENANGEKFINIEKNGRKENES